MSVELWTPEQGQLARQADAEREQLLNRAIEASPLAKATTRMLREVDPYLSCVYVDQRLENVPLEKRHPNMVPGRWHVKRSDPRYMDVYRPIMGEHGEYVEPGSKLIDDMKEADLWRQGALQELEDNRLAKERARERQEALEAEQRQDHMAEVWRAAKRVSGDGGMNRRTWGKS